MSPEDGLEDLADIDSETPIADPELVEFDPTNVNED